MKKFKFLPPYKSTGRTNFPKTKARSGVYLIKENSKLVYIGMSKSNLYKTLYRHFEVWRHSTQEVTTYRSNLKKNDYTVRVVFCTAAQAVKLERALIIKHKPRDNDNKYAQYTLKLDDRNLVDKMNAIPVESEPPF
jgi:excinuclease UvrABC nuclease subunit